MARKRRVKDDLDKAIDMLTTASLRHRIGIPDQRTADELARDELSQAIVLIAKFEKENLL